MVPTSKPRTLVAKNSSAATSTPSARPTEEMPSPVEEAPQEETLSPIAKLSFYLWIAGFSLLTLELLWNAVSSLFR